MQQIFNKVLLTFVSYGSDDLLDHLKKGDYSKPIWVPGDIFERQVREEENFFWICPISEWKYERLERFFSISKGFPIQSKQRHK